MNSLPDLRALEIAAAVIEEGSMSAAGERLRLTQSAVSQAMKRAEAQIGATLIYREKRPLLPTDAGRILVARMRDLGLHVERAVEEIRAAAARPERMDLRLGMIDSFASTVGPYLVRELMEGAMTLRLAALSGLVPAHSEALARHAIDAVVTSDMMTEVDDLERFPLYREPFVLAGPKGTGAALAEMPLKDLLRQYRLIRYSERSHMGAQIERHLRRLGLDHPRVLSFDTADALLSMVASGMGIAITTPLCLLQGGLHLSALDVRPLPRPGFSREVLLITRRGEISTLGPRIAASARTLIRLRILPQIVAQIPWLGDSVESMVLEPDGPVLDQPA